MQSETFTTQAMQTFSAVLLVTREYRYQTFCHEFHSHYCKHRRSAKLPLILKLKAELMCAVMTCLHCIYQEWVQCYTGFEELC